jgi:hypothetical protein
MVMTGLLGSLLANEPLYVPPRVMTSGPADSSRRASSASIDAHTR